jgi:peroxiredoxin
MSAPLTEGLKRAWDRPGVQRARQIGYWLLVAALAFIVYRRVAPSVELGDLGPAPPLEMTALDGGTVRLDDFRGEVVVVNVWATWCPPCRVETPGFVDLQTEFDGEVQFLGLSTDESEADVRAFAEEYGINYPLLVGPNRAGRGYRVPALPTTFLVDRDGRVRFRHEGLLLAHALRPALQALVRE